MTVPLHRIGLSILAHDIAAQLRTERIPEIARDLRYRLRYLLASVNLTDDELEALHDGMNRADPPPRRRMAHCDILQILEDALDSPADPDMDGDDVDA